VRTRQPIPVILDTHYLPRCGRAILVGNHYERPGLWGGWGAMVVSAAVWQAADGHCDVTWLMTAELLDVHLASVRVPSRWVRAVLARVADIYGLGLVEPREAGRVGGLSGLRRAARALQHGGPVGVLPEGTASRALIRARPGVGRALEWLASEADTLTPFGVWEQHGQLCVRFGPDFHLDVDTDAAATPVRQSSPRGQGPDRDRVLSDAVMVRIAELLPPEMWGAYAAIMERRS